MKRNHLFLVLAAALGSAAAFGCGDNSKQCGPGTDDADEDGICEAVDDGLECGEGTIPDETTGTCIIDPTSCQDGTVLVGGECVDAGRVDADIEEAAEPNGLGVLGEISDPAAGGAGTILVKDVGAGAFVIHGTIKPFQDADGDGQQDVDADTYLLEVTAPSLLDVSADGLHGLSGAFVSLAVVNVGVGDPLENWQRFGVTQIGDTSRRQLFLPAGGLYLLTIADTRSLFTGAAAGADPADPLQFEYFVSINQLTATPTPITITAGAGTVSDQIANNEVKLFSVAMGLGFNQVAYAVDGDLFTESLVIQNTSGGVTRVKELIDDPAATFTLGYKTGDTTIIAADNVLNFASSPVPFVINISTGDAVALPTDGTSVSQSESAAPLIDLDGDGVAEGAVFFYDVLSSPEVTGFDISFDQSVEALVLDEDRFIFSLMTDLGFGDTIDGYQGLYRHPFAGRYYWLVDEPSQTGATDITVTSLIKPLTPGIITKDTPIAASPIDQDFASNSFTYIAGTADSWQQFTSGGTNSGNVTNRFFDPSFTFGRLDDMISTCPAPFCDDVAPRFTFTHAAAGASSGRILIDDIAAQQGATTYFVTINTATAAANTTFDLNYTRRPHADLGTLNGGQTDAKTNEPLNAAAITLQRYLVRTTRDNEVAILVHPDGALLNTTIQQVNNNESPRGAAINNGALNADDTAQFYQKGDGWTAWTVQSAVPLVTAETFDQNTTILGAAYNAAAGATVFADACAGGTVVPMLNGANADNDEGVSDIITAPTGFDFFGAAAPSFRVFANGFISFNTATVCPNAFNCFFTNAADLPLTAAPNGLAMPYWDDLISNVCQKTMGTKLIIQWVGEGFFSGAQFSFQAILDGADDSIEFVYGGMQETGNGATVGLENLAGTKAKTISINKVNGIAQNSAQKLTVNP